MSISRRGRRQSALLTGRDRAARGCPAGWRSVAAEHRRLPLRRRAVV